MSKLFSKPKALLSMVLVLCMVIAMLPAGVINLLAGAADSDAIDVWDGVKVEPFENYYDEEGVPREVKYFYGSSNGLSDTHPYEIYTAAQFVFFLETIHETKTTFSGPPSRSVTLNDGETYYYASSWVGRYHQTTVKLMADIDLAGYDLTDYVDANTNTFAGTFDGNGHTIYNVKRTSTSSTMGLFRQAGYGSIRNLTVTGSISGSGSVGGLVGNLVGGGSIVNCAFIGDVTGSSSKVGGLVGTTSIYETAPVHAITNCYTSGTVKGTDNVGGLVGYSAYAWYKKATAANYSDFTHPCGGRVKLTNCYSAMDVTATSGSAGALGGGSASWDTYNPNTSYTITVNNESTTITVNKASCSDDGTGSGFAFTNCHYAGTVTASGTVYSPAPDDTAEDDSVYVGYTADDVDGITAELNAKVAELTEAGTTGLSNWMAGAGYPIFVQDVPALETLTVGGVASVDLTEYPTSYAQTVGSDVESITLVPAAKSGATVTMSAVDNAGNTVAVSDGTVALAEGRTTTVTITVTHKALTSTYTVNVYREPTPWDGSSYEQFANYAESIASSTSKVYEIANAKQLYFFALLMNEGIRGTLSNNVCPVTFDTNGNQTADEGEPVYNIPKISWKDLFSVSGTTVKLTADIDLGGHDFPVIGYGYAGTTTMKERGFGGTFEGNGYEIKNLNINTTHGLTGLFSRVYYKGKVQNLTVRGSVSSTSNYVGGIAGDVSGTVTMTNCAFIGDVSGVQYVGGLAGRTNPYEDNVSFTFDNCYSAGTLTAKGSTTSGGWNGVGGLLGHVMYYTITNADGSVKWYGGEALFTNCYSTMTITPWASDAATGMTAANGVGGLVGQATDTPGYVTYDNCYFAGSVCSDQPISELMTVSDVSRVTVKNGLYYKDDCYTSTAVGAGVSDDNEYTAEDFGSGTVAARLNTAYDGWNTWNGVPVYGSAPSFKMTGDSIDFASAVKNYAVMPRETYELNVTNVADGTIVVVSADKAEKLSAVGNDYTVTLDEGETVVLTIEVRRGKLVDVYTVTLTDSRWDGQPATAYASGDGTQATPYQIATAAQLAYLAQQVNGGTNYKNNYFELTADIDLSGYTWTPIGNGSKHFQGSFDGNEHTITGMTHVDTETTGAGYIALFGSTSAGAHIANVHIRDAELKAQKTQVAGLIGYCLGAATIENCTFSGYVEGAATSGDSPRVAGLIGYISTSDEVKIDNCAVLADSKIVSNPGTITYGQQGTGGLVGEVYSGVDLTMTNSYFAGEIDATSRANGESTIKGCRGVGGLIGVIKTGAANNTLVVDIQNCYTTGKIAGNSDVAGLVGYVRFNSDIDTYAIDLTINNCYSTAEIEVSSNSTTAGLIGPLYDKYTAAKPSITVKNSHFAGTAKYPIAPYSSTSTYAKLEVKNVYYRTGSGSLANQLVNTLNNDTTISITNVAEKTAEEFANGTVDGLLGDGWATSSKGYPIRSMFSVVDDALIKIGTSIRTFDPTGMRFYFKMDTASQIAGLKEYGVVLAKAENAENGLFVGGTKTAKAIAFDGETTVHVREDVEEDEKTYDYFTALLNFSTDKNFDTEYNARAYALYEDEDGQEIIVYSDVINSVDGDGEGGADPLPSTLTNVATLAYNDRANVDYSASEIAYLEAILK